MALAAPQRKRLSVSQSRRIALHGVALTSLVCVTLCLAACGNKEKAAGGQSLVRVNGQEITVHQLNDELAINNVPADKREAATRQLMEALIDRQLLEGEAARDKVDRDPAVIQAIERAKAQIIAQAYMQKRLNKVGKPTKEEVEKYYADHPELFTERRIYDLDQLVILSKDFSPELKVALTVNKSLDDVAAWVKEHHVESQRIASQKSTVEMPQALSKKLKELRKGQLFALQQGDRTGIVTVKGYKEDPAKKEVAEPEIAAFLFKKRNGEAADAEIARLRAAAKIEYLGKKPNETGALTPPSQTDKKESNEDHTKKGVADL